MTNKKELSQICEIGMQHQIRKSWFENSCVAVKREGFYFSVSCGGVKKKRPPGLPACTVRHLPTIGNRGALPELPSPIDDQFIDDFSKLY